MFDLLEESFLTEYFVYCSVAPQIIDDPDTLFNRLYEIFMLPPERRDAIKAMCSRAEVSEIRTYGDYMQYCRIRKYLSVTGVEDDLDAASRELIAVKGNALSASVELKLCQPTETTEVVAYRTITAAANAGNVAALRVLGLLQYEGIFVQKDEKAGRKNLLKAAGWNDLDAILTALYYCPEERQSNLDRLKTVTYDTSYDRFLALAELKYGIKAGACLPESKLLKKAFGSGILRAETYSAQHARVLFSRILPFRDKERALFAASRDALTETADLPLKLSHFPTAADEGWADVLPFDRAGERAKISRIAFGGDACALPAYRPLCICSDSWFVRKNYAAALAAAFDTANVVRIDVASLSAYDIEPTKNNNVFLRSCNEDTANVYILWFEGNIHERVIEAVGSFLLAENRAKFRLSRPAVEIDLGAILPICVCDRCNLKALKHYCDAVTVAPVAESEKKAAIANMAAEKRFIYGVASVELDEAAEKKLIEFSADRADEILDRVVRFGRRKGEKFTVTAEAVSEAAGEITARGNDYGFGRIGDEDKR